MFERDGLLPGEGTAWLLAIGRPFGRNTLLLKNPSPNCSPLCWHSLKNKSKGSGQDSYVRLPMKSGSSPRPHSHRPLLDSGEREGHLIGCNNRS